MWAVISYFVGSMLGGKSSIAEMARTLAYAQAPAFIAVLSFIPCIGFLFALAAFFLSLGAGRDRHPRVDGVRYDGCGDHCSDWLLAVHGCFGNHRHLLWRRRSVGLSSAPLIVTFPIFSSRGQVFLPSVLFYRDCTDTASLLHLFWYIIHKQADQFVWAILFGEAMQ